MNVAGLCSDSDCFSTRECRTTVGLAPEDESNGTGLVWFKRSDLRLTDHDPLVLAHRECSRVAHIFCLDDRWFGRTK